MKNRLNKFIVPLLAGLALAACTDHTEYDDTTFSAVEKLLYPSDGYSFDLIDQASANLYFEWEASKTGTPTYTVVFTDAAGREAGRYLADNNGQKASLTMPHRQLNAVAGRTGIAPASTGDIYWSVCAGLGGDERISPAAPHRFTVRRYASIDAPYSLYMTGEGSEFGNDPATAQPMRELGEGRFEIYTKVDGTFRFIDRNAAGGKRTFAIADGRLIEGADAAGEGHGIYRFRLNFNNGTASAESIDEVAMLRAGTRYDGSPLTTLQYGANGVWSADGFTVPTDGDDRYRFRASVDGHYEIWGSESGTDAQDPGQIDGGSYFNVYVHTDVEHLGNPNDYARIWKFYAPIKGLSLNIALRMSPDIANYRHDFDLGFDPVATPVAELLEPAADAAIALNAQAGASQTFSWRGLAGDTPDVKLTSYTIVFFADESQQTEIGRISAGSGTSKAVSYSELESLAHTAGIPAEGAGDIYWGVESKLLVSTALSATRKVTITRMKGIPTEAYITGPASEFGSGYRKLKALGGGKFEIFTKLTAGGYNFTDGDTPQARRFVVENGAVSESAQQIASTEEAIYYILVDFGSGRAEYRKIEHMRFLSPNTKNQHTDRQIYLPYQGNGIWYAAGVVPYMRDWDDDRYFFWADVDGVKTKFGADPGMSGDLWDAPAEGDERFRVHWPIADVNGDDAGAFKIIHDYRGNDSKRVNIKLNMSPDAEHYYNHIEYLY